jgi:hypothetical protein
MGTLYTQDTEEMLQNANAVKETILYALEREGLLKKPAQEIGEAYAIILHKRGWLGKFWLKWFDGVKEGAAIKCDLVKIV